MAVVVSDTTPLHYLILIGREAILERLYGRVFIPPGVLAELGHPSAPAAISAWAVKPPAWVCVAAPQTIDAEFEGLDFGERQALALAKEVKADLVLLDDKVARKFARRAQLAVKGTLGIVAEAASAGLLDFVETVESLRRTSMHIDPSFVDELVTQYRRSIRASKREEGKP